MAGLECVKVKHYFKGLYWPDRIYEDEANFSLLHLFFNCHSIK
ncbi:hypothetical protein ACFL35_05040 [Candidatus Riflebacteria bacterium]